MFLDLTAIAAKIQTARREQGFTQEELSARLGVSAQAVSKWERGLSLPDIDLLIDVAQILHLSVDYLLGSAEKAIAARPKTAYDMGANILDIEKGWTICILVSKALLSLFPEECGARFSEIRREMYKKWGVLLPAFRVMDDMTLLERRFFVTVRERVLLDHIWADTDTMTLDTLLTEVQSAIESDLSLFINRHMTKLLMENLRRQLPFAVEGVIPERVTLSELTCLLRTLIERKASICDLARIIEALDEQKCDVALIGKASEALLDCSS